MIDLTVCVPVYNVESYLKQCVESILGQTYRDIQVILVDDGSTDASGRICNEFAQRDERVKVLHERNEGPIAARYAALKEASTKYITFVDADDWLDLHMYEDLIRLAKQTECEVVASGKKSYFSEGDIRDSYDQFEEGFYETERVQSDIVPYMIWNRGYCLDPSLAVKIFLRKKILYQYERLIRDNFHYGEDMAIVYPLVMESQSVFITHKAYYYHRQRKRNEVPGYIADDEFFAKLLYLYQYLVNISKEVAFHSKLKAQLDLWYIESVNLKKKCYSAQEISIKWLFPFGQVRRGAEIVLYGAGKVGQTFFRQIEKTRYCNVVAWVDLGAKDIQPSNFLIEQPECIECKEYDVVVIAIKNRCIRKELVARLVEKYAVKREKIIWDWDEELS